MHSPGYAFKRRETLTRSGNWEAWVRSSAPKRQVQNRQFRLVEAERNFDGYDRGYNFAVRPDGRLELPALYSFNGFLFQPEARTFHYRNVDCTSIGSDGHLQHNGAL